MKATPSHPFVALFGAAVVGQSAVRVLRQLRAALAGVAEFTPRTKSIGWCWCGGSIRHGAACLKAQAALEAADPFLPQRKHRVGGRAR